MSSRLNKVMCTKCFSNAMELYKCRPFEGSVWPEHRGHETLGL